MSNYEKEVQDVLNMALEKMSMLVQKGCVECFAAFDKAGQFNSDNARLAVQMTTERVAEYIAGEIGATFKKHTRI